MKRKVTIYKGGKKIVEYRGGDKEKKKEVPEKSATIDNEKPMKEKK